MFWPIDVRIGVDQLSRLLLLIEQAVEDEVRRCYAGLEVAKDTPIGAEEPFLVALGRIEQAQDNLITAARDFRLWVYGGFITTALTWLADRLLLITNYQAHPFSKVARAKYGLPVTQHREPYLWHILAEWLDDDRLRERMDCWISLRNRYVHSLGIVADAAERARLLRVLGIAFDTHCRAELMSEHCRDLLADVEAVGVLVAETADVK